MVTSETLPHLSSRSRMRSAGKLVAFLLLILIVPVPLWFVWTAKRSLPQVEGQIKVRGLRQPVSVLRDAQGMPHIRAQNEHDLFFAQGYVTAQDRLFQMDIDRRFAAGELSEVLGKNTLALDREQRILGFRQVAERAAAKLSANDRAAFEAYASGVTAFIEAQRRRLPIEFHLLGYQPRPWTVVDSFLIGTNLAKALNHGFYQDELIKEAISAKLGSERSADIFRSTSWRDRPPTEEAKHFADDPPAKQSDEDQDDDDAPDTNIAHSASSRELLALVEQRESREEMGSVGSNNWVVSGEHTVTGKPLLSNDMHLDYSVPGIWYAAQLELTDGSFNVAGVTLPGDPFVIVGHNQRIAWGVTNVEPDVEDLYVEKFNAQGEYQAGTGWRQLQHRRETIHVKGAPDETVDVVITRHGPVITPLLEGETRQLALRWTVYDDDPFGLPFPALNRAQNWEQFRHALSTFSLPGQNFVFADADGHIGYQMTGKYPIRAQGDGSVPVPGNDDAHEWTGYVPFDKLPNVFDPPQGIIASANSRVVPDDFPTPISTYWDATFRTERIYEVLESGRKFAPQDMLMLQTDVKSEFEKRIADQFVLAADHSPKLSARAKQAVELLRAWDGRVLAKDSPASVMVVYLRRRLVREILQSEFAAHGLPQEVLKKWTPNPRFLDMVLEKRPKEWLPAGIDNYDALFAQVLDQVVSSPEAPRDLAKWQRGKTFKTHVEHELFARIPVIGGWLPASIAGPGAVAMNGSGWTVNANGGMYGPSERITMSTADWDGSTLNIVTGESGQPLSPHYLDQWNAFSHRATFAWRFTRAAVDASTQQRLELLPQ